MTATLIQQLLTSSAPRMNCMNTKININTHKQHGSSLLETMVSLFVLAIGLLGTLAMQTKSIQHNQNSYSYSQAIVLATDISERLIYTANGPADVALWQQEVAQRLPAGNAVIAGGGNVRGQQTITISFRETGSVGADGNLHQINFQTWLP
jgi:Prokaryotic N-terminal methylation motif